MNSHAISLFEHNYSTNQRVLLILTPNQILYIAIFLAMLQNHKLGSKQLIGVYSLTQI